LAHSGWRRFCARSNFANRQSTALTHQKEGEFTNHMNLAIFAMRLEAAFSASKNQSVA
jgi:hypothetical protein